MSNPRSISFALRAEILEDECHYCGSINSAVVDHLDPVVQGGGKETGNLVAACERCNAEKGGKTPSQWRSWRLARNYPWPPPNTDETVRAALTELDLETIQALRSARQWGDARADEALDHIRDRAWVGDDGYARSDAEGIRAALVGERDRFQATRQRELRRLVEVAAEYASHYNTALQQIEADPIGGPIHKLNWALGVGKRQVANEVTAFATRFLDDNEREVASRLVDDLNGWEALRARIIEDGQRAIEFGVFAETKTSGAAQESFHHVVARIRERMSRTLADFSAHCDADQNLELRLILPAKDAS